ncbi:hypothetical protein LCGC14_0357080 [marine sediment metagenome]|uniref:Uncharacterized protein n=1 Tax=marine sediment metagenome TaxID=412755 RepID=A0A0F9TEN5_9ZZZZ
MFELIALIVIVVVSVVVLIVLVHFQPSSSKPVWNRFTLRCTRCGVTRREFRLWCNDDSYECTGR